jgi:hypothetical protein
VQQEVLEKLLEWGVLKSNSEAQPLLLLELQGVNMRAWEWCVALHDLLRMQLPTDEQQRHRHQQAILTLCRMAALAQQREKDEIDQLQLLSFEAGPADATHRNLQHSLPGVRVLLGGGSMLERALKQDKVRGVAGRLRDMQRLITHCPTAEDARDELLGSLHSKSTQYAKRVAALQTLWSSVSAMQGLAAIGLQRLVRPPRLPASDSAAGVQRFLDVHIATVTDALQRREAHTPGSAQQLLLIAAAFLDWAANTAPTTNTTAGADNLPAAAKHERQPVRAAGRGRYHDPRLRAGAVGGPVLAGRRRPGPIPAAARALLSYAAAAHSAAADCHKQRRGGWQRGAGGGSPHS